MPDSELRRFVQLECDLQQPGAWGMLHLVAWFSFPEAFWDMDTIALFELD
jgi:hypothetical protein